VRYGASLILRFNISSMWAAGWGKPNAANIDGINEYIGQLCQMDADSFSFR
jgi:hypothetical protein